MPPLSDSPTQHPDPDIAAGKPDPRQDRKGDILDCLNGVAEKASVVALLPLGNPFLLGVLAWRLVFAVTAGVLPTQVDGHEDGQNGSHDLAGEKSAEAGVVAGAVLGQEEVGRNGTAQVAEADVHGNADTALEGTANVVAVPRDTLGDVGVDTRGEEEAAKVADTGIRRRNQANQSNDAARITMLEPFSHY